MRCLFLDDVHCERLGTEIDGEGLALDGEGRLAWDDLLWLVEGVLGIEVVRVEEDLLGRSEADTLLEALELEVEGLGLVAGVGYLDDVGIHILVVDS